MKIESRFFGVACRVPADTFHLRVTCGGYRQFSVSLACWLFALSFYLDQWTWLRRWKLFRDWKETEIYFAIERWTIFWHLWTNEHDMEAHPLPAWRDVQFPLDDFFLGSSQYRRVDSVPVPVLIPLPEGDYFGTATFFTQTWKRPRWPVAKHQKGAIVDLDGGIPVPGKGEDLTFTSIGTAGTTIEEAIREVMQTVSTQRERYGGKGWLPKEVAK